MNARRGARGVWLFQNVFDEVQFPDHVLSASSSPSGGEAYRVATGRRSAIDAWTPGAENTTHFVEVNCQIPRAVNLCIIDRGHNLDSTLCRGFFLEARDSTTCSWSELWRSTDVPTSAQPGPSTAIDGIRTWEGALVHQFPVSAWRYYRLRIPASTGYAPVVRNLALGLAWSPSEPALAPSDYDQTQVAFEETVSPSGWRGSGRVSKTRAGSALYRLTSFGEYLNTRVQLGEYQSGRISWYIPRRARAEEAICVKMPPVTFPAPMEPGWPYRSVSVPYREHEPRPL